MNLKQAIQLHKQQCEKDAVYFATNFCYIQHPIRKKIKFDMFDVQKQALSDLQNYQYNIALKSRQMGFSTLVAAYILWLMTFSPDSNVLVIATKLNVAKNMVTKIKEMYKSLPKWLQEETEEYNKTLVRFKNGSQVQAVGATEDSGRSEALTLLVIDECIQNNTKIKLRNKKTGEIKEVEIGKFFDSI